MPADRVVLMMGMESGFLAKKEKGKNGGNIEWFLEPDSFAEILRPEAEWQKLVKRPNSTRISSR